MDKKIVKRKINKHLFVALFTVACLFLFAGLNYAYGQGLVPESGKALGNYGLDDFLLLGVNVAKWILGIVGSIALLFFIYGGFTFLISAGNSAQVDKGKNIIIGAVVGLVIVFASYLIIKFVLQAFGANGCIQAHALDGYMCMEKSYSPNPGSCVPLLCPQDSSATFQCCPK